MSPSDLKEVTAAVQAIGVTLAIAAGGVWSIWRFRNLRERERAEVDLKKAAQSTKETGTLQLSLVATALNDSATQSTYLHARITIRNVGNRIEVVDWRNSQLNAAKVLGYGKGLPKLSEFSDHYSTAVTGRRAYSVLAPAEANEYHFLVPTLGKGIYYLNLQLQGSPENTVEMAVEASRLPTYKESDITLWSVEGYFSSEPASIPPIGA